MHEINYEQEENGDRNDDETLNNETMTRVESLSMQSASSRI